MTKLAILGTTALFSAAMANTAPLPPAVGAMIDAAAGSPD